MTTQWKPDTHAAAHGIGKDPTFRSVSPPLYLSANYAWPSAHEKPALDYSRTNNPSRNNLEAALCELEGAARCIVTSSGMSAVNLLLCLLEPGDRVLAPHDCYGGTYRLLNSRVEQGWFEVDFVDQNDEQAYQAALARKPKIVFIETPSNPLLRLVDVRKAAAEAKAAGAIVAADNTFLSPARQQPLSLGCDVVFHSTTKFINGHSDVVGGAVLTADEALGESLAWWANNIGATGAPFDSFLTLRGLRTLFARIDRQEATAQTIARTLSDDPRISRIHYPGLETHPGYEIAQRQQSGPGSLMSFELSPDLDVGAFIQALELFTLAPSLGGFESLICLPAAMVHGGMSAEARATAGLGDTLVRVSVGLEHPEDLLNDLHAALAQVERKAA